MSVGELPARAAHLLVVRHRGAGQPTWMQNARSGLS